MATRCTECKSYKIHSFSVRSEYGTFHALNGTQELSDSKPYYLDGYYCEACNEAVSVEEG